ncbi:MAG: sugar phosphate isomerase family [Armatimonadota bacterium]
MTRPISKLVPGWWDFTTIDQAILDDAAKLTAEDMLGLSREGFKVVYYDSIEEFYCAEALEYIEAWQQSTPNDPVGICGPIGPTEQLPLVARMVNAMGLNLNARDAHFWGMDEWIIDGKEAAEDHPLSFAKADKELLFNRIRPELAMKPSNMHFPKADNTDYVASWETARCAVMQGGQGDIKHWAFNDPLPRTGKYQDNPPTPEEYLKLSTRVVNLHPVTVMQNARTSGGGKIDLVPSQAVSVGPLQTWKSEKVSIWHAGCHDNPFGMRLTTLMIAKKLADSAVPMSLLGLHPNVQFNFLRSGIGSCAVEMH